MGVCGLMLLDLLQLRRDDAHGGRGISSRREWLHSRRSPRRATPFSVLLLAAHARVSRRGRCIYLRPSSSSCARALLMKLLGRAGALSQRARCGSLRFPFLPLVRRLSAKVGHHRTSLRRPPLPLQHYARPPSPRLLTPSVITAPAPPRRPLAAVFVARSRAKASVRATIPRVPPHTFAPCPLTALRSLLSPLLTLVFPIHAPHSGATWRRSYPSSRPRCRWTSTESRGQASFVLHVGLAARPLRRAPP